MLNEAVNVADLWDLDSFSRQFPSQRPVDFDVLITHIRIIITKGISKSVIWIKPNRSTTVIRDCIYYKILDFGLIFYFKYTMSNPEV